MNDDVIEKIGKLMALALNNPNEEEARSAAMKAVRLIKESGLRLVPAPQPDIQDASWIFERLQRDRERQARYNEDYLKNLNDYLRQGQQWRK